MEQGTELFWFEHQILLLAWGVTVVLQLFYSLNLYGVLPNGAFGLQFHIPPITSCVYVMAFFIVACCHFALKFQEAEYLNVHLEGIVREKTEAQSALIRSMLHNLKTPLFSVVGYADMAASRLENPAQARRCLTKVSEKAQYVSGLLDRLFLLTQMDANQMVFQRVPVRLGELLASVAENARLKGKEKGIAVTLEGVQDALCMGDPLYLQQSFQNIADNAVEYVGQGGVLYITVRQDANGWAVCIADNGCGISTEELPKIFDRYYSNHYGKRNSSGLGLSIAKEIVERHGGRITVQSEPGRGTAFTVWLPDGENADHVASAEKI
jgi:signal transduction histidine kinase